MEVTGGCLCGAVRYSVTAPPLATRVCWCRVCQYLAAGNGTVNTCFPSNAITIEGQLTDYSRIADSGNVMPPTILPEVWHAGCSAKRRYVRT